MRFQLIELQTDSGDNSPLGVFGYDTNVLIWKLRYDYEFAAGDIASYLDDEGIASFCIADVMEVLIEMADRCALWVEAARKIEAENLAKALAFTRGAPSPEEMH